MPLIERWREDLRSPTTAAAPPLALRHPTLSPSAAADSIWNMESVSQRGTYATPRKPAAPRSVSLERPTKESASARAMSHTRTGSSTSSSSSASSTRKPRSPARPSPRRARPPATAPAYPYATPQLRYDYGVPLSPMQPVYPAPPTPASYELEKPNWPDRRYERAQEDAKRDRTARRKRRCFFVAGGLLLLVALGLGLGLGLRSKAPGEVHAGGEGEGLQLARPPSRTAISAGGIAASEVKPVERQPARTADQGALPRLSRTPLIRS